MNIIEGYEDKFKTGWLVEKIARSQLGVIAAKTAVMKFIALILNLIKPLWR